MLTKIIGLKNVGRFQKCSPSGDVEFQKLNLIFGGNGSGKTTLCSVMRSLQSGDANYLLQRRTRGQTDEPQVTIRTEQGNLRFENGSWSSTVPEIVVYDSEFIHDNVYAGETIDHEQKKRLHRVMIGEEGVSLARKVDELDEAGREIANEIRAKMKTVEAYLPDGIKLKEFLELEAQDGIEKAIEAKAGEVAALEQTAKIREKSTLKKITIPELPKEFDAVLGRELEDVGASVESQVQQHIDSHTNQATNDWLADGINYRAEDLCPFCGQDTSGVSLVKAYSALFGKAYRELKNEVASIQAEVNTNFGEASLLRSDKTAGNDTLFEFWKQFVSFSKPALDFASDVLPAVRELQKLASGLLEQKAASLLERVCADQIFAEARTGFEAAKRRVDEYNALVDIGNALIEKQKEATDVAKVDEERRTLRRLEAAKKRHEAEVCAACMEYEVAVDGKARLDAEKEQARTDLNAYSEDVFARYKRRINELLPNFAADFRIGDITPSYAGGHPSSSYPVVINEDTIDVGDAKTPRGTPSFRSTLSAGDRSSLALAFFIAQLESHPSIADMVIVFDDPFTSQDRSRRTYTQQLICHKARSAKQVIVTSHDMRFLELIWDGKAGIDTKSLQLVRLGNNGSTIAECDIKEETRTSFMKDLAHLKEFVSHGTSGDPRDVARKIRPVLEAYLRLSFLGEFREHEWLGDFIKKIRDAADPSPLVGLQGNPLGEIEDINGFSKTYHHEQNPGNADTAPIDDGELKSYVSRSINLVGSS